MKFKPTKSLGSKRYKPMVKKWKSGMNRPVQGYTGSNPSVTNIAKSISDPSLKRTIKYDKQGRVTKTTDKSALNNRQKARIANQALNIETIRQIGSMSRVANIADSSARAAEAAAKLISPQITGKEDASVRTTSDEPEEDNRSNGLRDELSEKAGNLWNYLTN